MKKPIKALLLLSVGALLASCSIFSADSSSNSSGPASSAQPQSSAEPSSASQVVPSSEVSSPAEQSSERSSEAPSSQASESVSNESSEIISSQSSESASSESSSVPSTPVYGMKVGNAVIELHRNLEASNEEYSAHLDLSEGDVLQFVKDGAPIEVRPDADVNNNVALIEGSLKVRQAKEGADVYLKVNSDGRYEVWVSGYVAPEVVNVYKLVLDNGNLVDMAKTEDAPEGIAEQYKATLSVTSGQIIRFLLNGELITVAADADANNNLVADQSGSLRVKKDAADVDLYLKLKANGGYEAWLAGYVEPISNVYTVKVGEGEAITLTQMEDGQLTATLDVKKGDVITFYKDGTLIAATAETYEGNNLVNTEAGMVVHNDAEKVGIYLKVRENDKYEVWLSGFVADPTPVSVYAMLLNGEFKNMAETETHPEGTKAQYHQVATLAAGQELLFSLDGKPISVVPSASDEQNKNNAIVNDEQKVVVHNAVTDADVYLKVMADGSYEVWVTGYEEPEPITDVFTMQVGSGEPITLVLNAEAQGVEYMGEATVASGDELKVFLNDKALSFRVDPDKNNNLVLGEDNLVTFRQAGKSTVYVKALDGGWLVWASGYTPEAPVESAYGVQIGNNEPAAMALNEKAQGVEYFLTSDLKAGDPLKFILDGNPIVVVPEDGATNNVELNQTGDLIIRQDAKDAGIYLKVLEGGVYKVWVGGYVAPEVPTGVFKVDVGAEKATLVATEEHPEGTLAQYSVTVSLAEGQVIFFYLDDKVLAVTADPDENNNVELVDGDLKIRKAGEAITIYLKQLSDGTYQVWASGYQEEAPAEMACAVQIGNKEPAAMALNDKAQGVEYYIISDLVAEEPLKFIVNGQPVDAVPESGENNNVALTQSGDLLVKQAAEDAGIYLKVVGDGTYKVWVGGIEKQEDPEPAAVYDAYLGETKIALTKSEETSENWKEQYEGKHDVKAGDVLTFKKDGAAIAVKADAYQGNNVKEEEGKLVIVNDAEEAGIYLKLLNDGTYSLWVGGYQAEQPVEMACAVQIGNKEPAAMALNDKAQGVEYYIISDLVAEEPLKFIVNGKPVDAVPEDGENNNVALTQSGDLLVKQGAKDAGIYLKVIGDGTYKVWVGGIEKQEDPEPAAVYDAYLGETKIALTKSEGTSENWKEQYEGKHDLKAGDVLTFKKDGAAIAVNADAYQGNNVKEEEGKLVIVNDAEDAGIYLKLLDDGTYSLWVGGYVAPAPEEAVFAMTYGESGTAILALNEAAQNTEYVAKISVKQGDVLHFTKDGQPLSVSADPYATNNVKANEQGELVVQKDADNVNVYLKLLGDGTYQVWLEGGSVQQQQEPEQGQGQEQQSETFTLYFRDASWWNEYAAATMIKIDDAAPVKMTHVAWVEAEGYNIWKAEVPEDAVYVSFLRYNEAGTEYWGAATDQIQLSRRQTHNMYDISGTSAAWKDQQLVIGAWGDYQVQIEQESFLVNPISSVSRI